MKKIALFCSLWTGIMMATAFADGDANYVVLPRQIGASDKAQTRVYLVRASEGYARDGFRVVDIDGDQKKGVRFRRKEILNGADIRAFVVDYLENRAAQNDETPASLLQKIAALTTDPAKVESDSSSKKDAPAQNQGQKSANPDPAKPVK